MFAFKLSIVIYIGAACDHIEEDILLKIPNLSLCVSKFSNTKYNSSLYLTLY